MNTDLILRITTITIGGVALGISFFSWRSSRVSIRQTIKNSYMSALFEIDKLMINNPSLWAIYDNSSKFLSKPTEPIEKAKRRSFIFYHFNLFEVTHTNYTRILFLNKADKEFWNSMEKYIRQFFKDSSEARQIFKEQDIQELYLPDFLKLINKIIDEIEPTK